MATVLKTTAKWYHQRVTSGQQDDAKVPRDQELTLKREAENLWQQDFAAYQKTLQKGPKKNEVKWQQTVIRSGALADKIAAHSLMIQSSPVHALSSLASLIKVAQSKTKREYLMCIDRIKDLFLADLLPPTKLRYFSQSVVNLPQDEKNRRRALILAYFEDQIKFYYKQFIEAVEAMSHDSVAATKSSSINVLYHLLAGNPEQEAFLLEKLVNKLGDPVSKTASHVVFLLKKLVTENHPAMKEVVCKEVERFLFRSNLKERAQYYSICFLQDVKFNKQDKELANRLMDMYFGFFKKCTQEADMNNKLMLSLLTGLSRAMPYSSMGSQALAENMETLFKMIHICNVNIAVQALSLIFVIVAGKSKEAKRNKQEKSAKNQFQDRYYMALYRFLLREELENTSRSAMLFNLLYRSLKRDHQGVRVLAFIKRLLQVSDGPLIIFQVILIYSFQVACSVSAQFAAGILFLISELAKQRSLASFFRKKLLKDPVASSSDHYDMTARNPLFCNPQKSAGLWELHFLMNHQHPSVALFARNVVDGKAIEYDGDVLNDFSTKSFLDRFVMRNAKKSTSTQEIGQSGGKDDEIMMDSDAESIESDDLDQLLFEDGEDVESSDDSLSLNEEDFEDEIRELKLSKRRKVS